MSNVKELNINWGITADEIRKLAKDIVEETNKRCDEIAKVKDLTYENVLVPLNEMDIEFDNVTSFLRLLDTVVSHKEISEALAETVRELSKYTIELKMRKDIFDVLQKFNDTNKENISKEAKRYVERSIIERKDYGLHLDESVRNRIKEIREKLSDLQIKFLRNLKSDNPTFPFKVSDLDGVNQGVIDELEKTDNSEVLVSLKYPVYFPVIRQCKVPATRKKLVSEFESRCVDQNIPLLNELIQLRSELATLLGHKTYADFTLQLCDARSPKTIEAFLDKLIKKFEVLRKSETKAFLELKKKECEALNIPFDGVIRHYDIEYYTNMRANQQFTVDHSKLQEYFPAEVVQNGIFSIYQKILGLEFKQLDVATYDPDVKLHEVRDKETKQVCGYFYIDLYPREGKFGHMANFPIKRGCLRKNGERQLPVCVMACNFTKATDEKPALLTHEEVEVFFHEFGHVMHHMCARANFLKFSGTNVEVDFVEAPSQMLENWVWEKESLRLMSKHYKNGSPIDDALLDKLIESRRAGIGFKYLYDIVKIKMDQIFHQNSKVNTREIYAKYMKELLDIDIDERVNGASSFGHIVAGYDAKYYSYLWSEVYSYDMFRTRFRKEGVLNEKTGMDYRRYILQPGGTLDAKDMLINFLGREPNENAFIEGKGLNL